MALPAARTWGRQPLSLARWLKALVVAACAALVAVEGWRGWAERAEALLEAERDLSALVSALGQHAEDTFRMSDLVLIDMVDRLERAGASPDALAALEGALAKQAGVALGIRGYSVYDETGRRLLTTGGQPVTSNVKDARRAYFFHHLFDPSREAHVGPPIVGLTSKLRVITITRRYDRPDGSFGGVALATIRAEYFSEYYRQFEVGRRGTIVLLCPEGTEVARSSTAESAVGRDFASGALFTGRSPGGLPTSVLYTSPSDGLARLAAYHRGDRYPVVVTAALTESEVLAPWRRQLLARMETVALLALILGFLGWRLADHVGRRYSTAAHLAETDPLTGLANRRAFDRCLAAEWRRAARERAPVSLLIVDVDRFKSYNDLYGHPAGDAAIALVAAELARFAQRPGDLAARYGGEEFAIILSGTDAAGAARVAEGVRARIEELALPHEASPPRRRLTVSIGHASAVPAPAGEGAAAEAGLVAAADAALYAAKLQGRNRVVAAGPHTPRPPAASAA